MGVNINKFLELASIHGDKIVDESIPSSAFEPGAVGSAALEAGSILPTHLNVDTPHYVLQQKHDLVLTPANNFLASAASSDSFSKEIFDNNKLGINGNTTSNGVFTLPAWNKSYIVQSGTTRAIEEEATGLGKDVYGRITQDITNLQGDTFTYSAGQLVGVNSIFVSELEEDMLIVLPDGELRRVTNIVSDTIADLTTGVEVGNVVSLDASKFTISYFYLDGSNVETAYAFSDSVQRDVDFPETCDIDNKPFGSGISGRSRAESLAAGHDHDDMYYTKPEINKSTDSTGSSLVGVNNTSNIFTSTTVQATIGEVSSKFGEYSLTTALASSTPSDDGAKDIGMDSVPLAGVNGANVHDVFVNLKTYIDDEEIISYSRLLIIVNQNQLPDLPYAPHDNESVVLVINNFWKSHVSEGLFTCSSTGVMTFDHVAAGFNIEITDSVFVLASVKKSDM